MKTGRKPCVLIEKLIGMPFSGTEPGSGTTPSLEPRQEHVPPLPDHPRCWVGSVLAAWLLAVTVRDAIDRGAVAGNGR